MFKKRFWYKSLNIALPLIILFAIPKTSYTASPEQLWEIRAVDTMKFSRDAAREDIPDSAIIAELTAIKQVGATHVGIATPYDEEFYPMLKRWVEHARDLDLKIWFRGNFSGWEG